MKTVLTALALVAGLAACEQQRGEDSARVGEGVESVDTAVTTRTTQDTIMVRSDTQVEVDTTVREGGVINRDTLNR